jgi:hypothetical protein
MFTKPEEAVSEPALDQMIGDAVTQKL